MDNVACYGLEDKLVECNYHTDTTEDDHSNDIWINCDTTEQSNEQLQLTARAGLGMSLILLIVVIGFFAIIVIILHKNKKRTYTTEW